MTHCNLIFTVLLILLYASCTNFGSEEEQESIDDIEFRILNEKLYLKEDRILVNVEVINNTDSSFLMFSFESLHESLSKESYYANNTLNYPSGLAMFIYDREGNFLEEQELPHLPVEFDDLSEMKNKSDQAYVDRMLFLKANIREKLQLQIDLKYYRPEPGVYTVYLIYYSGKNLYNFVPKDKVTMYEKEYEAHEFKGWLKSDTVELIVE